MDSNFFVASSSFITASLISVAKGPGQIQFAVIPVSASSTANVRVICNNPFETDTEKVTELVRTIQKTNLRRTSLSKLVIQS